MNRSLILPLALCLTACGSVMTGVQPSASDCGVTEAEFERAKAEAKASNGPSQSDSIGKCRIRQDAFLGVVVFLDQPANATK